MRRTLVLTVVLAALPVLAAPAAGARTPAAPAHAARTPAAIEGSWSADLQAVAASGGARPRFGAEVVRTFTASSCTGSCDAQLQLAFPGGGHPTVRFERGRRGVYKGAARTRLRCAGGTRVRARVAVRFKATGSVQRAGRRLASTLAGTARLTGTCGGRPAELALSWTAGRSDIPEPPTAGFSLGPDPVSLTADGGVVTFDDTSVDDLDGGTIVSRVWEFGDPAAGDANAAEGAHVSHRYTSTGTFTVRLTVTDDDGVSATVADVVSVEP